MITRMDIDQTPKQNSRDHAQTYLATMPSPYLTRRHPCRHPHPARHPCPARAATRAGSQLCAIHPEAREPHAPTRVDLVQLRRIVVRELSRCVMLLHPLVLGERKAVAPFLRTCREDRDFSAAHVLEGRVERHDADL